MIVWAGQAWQGIGGEYTVHLGENSEAKNGQSKGLTTLHATTNGISRLWLGSASANKLATGSEISAPQDLLDKLDATLALPLPLADWEF